MSLIALAPNGGTHYLTDNFTNTEILNASHWEENDEVVYIDEVVVNIAQYIRTQTGKAVTVNSAYRSPEYNATVEGASSGSQHPKSRALDIKGEGVLEFMTEAYETRNEHWQAMWNMGLRGLGFYSWGIHIDTREQNRLSLWGYSKKKTKSVIVLWVILLAFLGFLTSQGQ